MTQKEMLTKILRRRESFCESCIKNNLECDEVACAIGRNIIDTADFLLANGVIILPCKVGDTVFCIRKNPYAKGRYVKENTAYRVSFCVDGYISIFSTKEDVLGKTVFLTRKEAEAALKKMEERDGN